MLTTGRSGSSMFAGIFHHHGVFTGRNQAGDKFNEKGHFENLDIKIRMKNRFGFDLLGSFPEYDPDWSSQVNTILHQQGYRGGPWLMKTGALYYNIWQDYRPKFLKVRRNIDSILASYQGTFYLKSKYTPEEIEKIIRRQMDLLHTLPGCWLDYELALKGDFSQLEDAFIWCGLSFDPGIADSFIDTTLRHF